MTRRPRTALFINAHSRRAKRSIDKVVGDFTKKSSPFNVVEVIVVTNLKQLSRQLERLKAIDKLECVIVGSGDGTIVSVLNALADRKITYGFLPLGTSNTFVRSLGLPLTYPLARNTIFKRHARPASLGAINGKLFANIAGIGIPTEVTKITTNKIKKILGPFAYIVNGLKALRGSKAIYCHIVNDEINEGFYTHYLLFANGKYHGNLSLGKEVSVYNDKLVLMAFGVSESRRHYAEATLSLVLRRHKKADQMRIIPFDRLYVTTKPRQKIEADGELLSQTPATIEVKKDAIRVFAKPLAKTGSTKPRPGRKLRKSR